MVQEEMRKGPWTEQEDLKLVSFVGLFGDRRWDFIAKVSGLNRTGKSCRLRWVNYLHPGLKREKMTPHEERLIMELHSKWGNRYLHNEKLVKISQYKNFGLQFTKIKWIHIEKKGEFLQPNRTAWWSRIARKLPGRTDNEIKNFWRTQMRKQKAQEKKNKHEPESTTPISPTSSSCISSLSSSSSNNNNNNHVVDSNASKKSGEESFYDTGGPNSNNNIITDSSSNDGTIINVGLEEQDFVEQGCYYSMDDIWKDIAMSEEEEGNNFISSCPPMIIPSPSWEYSSEPLWIMMDELEEESKVLFPTSDQFFSSYDDQAKALNF